ncbi:endonuclease [Photobacterium minamisatsumaniensis]|uniref:endonuclease n=1 Tax=Photobacterium minamisatsumaniensis TaxID=2910233 RepID=UPI003D0BDC61
MTFKKILAAAALSLLAVGCSKDHEEENTMLVIELMTDRAANEISWELYDGDAKLIRQGSGYDNETYYEIPVALQPQSYRFVLKDIGKDGICCTSGAGSVTLKLDGEVIAHVSDVVHVIDEDNQAGYDNQRFIDEYIKRFDVAGYSGHLAKDLRPEYENAEGLRGYELKTALHQIVKKSHQSQPADNINGFIAQNDLDFYYGDKDGKYLVDIFSKNPKGVDSYNYEPDISQCSNISHDTELLEEGICYAYSQMFRPEMIKSRYRKDMENDIHHIFGTDQYINSLHNTDNNNAKPFGWVDPYAVIEKGLNGTQIGYGHPEFGKRNFFVFEPINEFKGDIARAMLYFAVRYEDVVVSWMEDLSNNHNSAGRILDGSDDQFFQTWQLRTLMRWHEGDPVSQKERDRNDAAEKYQGNRNPFIDHPELVDLIWRVEGNKPWIDNE